MGLLNFIKHLRIKRLERLIYEAETIMFEPYVSSEKWREANTNYHKYQGKYIKLTGSEYREPWGD